MLALPLIATRNQVVSVFLATILIALFGCGGGSSSSLPPQITAGVPNAQGMGIISGQPGSVPGNSEITVSPTDPPAIPPPGSSDCSEVSVESAPDGSFSVTVCDHPGETLFILATSNFLGQNTPTIGQVEVP
jgi:hypothetical protein